VTHRPAKYLLAFRGIPQSEIARTYGTSAPYVNDCLSGRKKPSPKLRAHVARMLGLPEATVWPEFPNPEIERDPATNGAPESTSTEGANLDRSSTLYA
jgi:transcriptional regulator with XRE-family HTH domain